MTQFFSSGCQISENREEAANDKVFVPTAQSRIQARDLLIITDLIRIQTRDILINISYICKIKKVIYGRYIFFYLNLHKQKSDIDSKVCAKEYLNSKKNLLY